MTRRPGPREEEDDLLLAAHTYDLISSFIRGNGSLATRGRGPRHLDIQFRLVNSGLYEVGDGAGEAVNTVTRAALRDANTHDRYEQSHVPAYGQLSARMADVAQGLPIVPVLTENPGVKRDDLATHASREEQDQSNTTIQQRTRETSESAAPKTDLDHGGDCVHNPLANYPGPQLETWDDGRSTVRFCDSDSKCNGSQNVQPHENDLNHHEITTPSSPNKSEYAPKFERQPQEHSRKIIRDIRANDIGLHKNTQHEAQSTVCFQDGVYSHSDIEGEPQAVTSGEEKIAAPGSNAMSLDGTQDDDIAQGSDQDGDLELTSSQGNMDIAAQDDSDSDYVESPDEKKKKKQKNSKQDSRKRSSGHMSEGPSTPIPKKSRLCLPTTPKTPTPKAGAVQTSRFQSDSTYALSPSDPGVSPGVMTGSPRGRSINKSGQPRKEREPRPKLMRWNDADWRRAVLSLIGVCGEVGIAIPFEKVARSINENLTGTAFQQALLKLRTRMTDEGYEVPVLKMRWSKKDDDNNTVSATSPLNTGEGNSGGTTTNLNEQEKVKVVWRTPRRKPTKDQEVQTSICTVKVSLATHSPGDHRANPESGVQETPTRIGNVRRSMSANHLPVKPTESDPEVRMNSRRRRQQNNIGNNVQHCVSSITSQPTQNVSMDSHGKSMASYVTDSRWTQPPIFGGLAAQDTDMRDYSGFPDNQAQAVPEGSTNNENTTFAGYNQYYHLPSIQPTMTATGSFHPHGIDDYYMNFANNNLVHTRDQNDPVNSIEPSQNNGTPRSKDPLQSHKPVMRNRLAHQYHSLCPINGISGIRDNHDSLVARNALTMDSQLVRYTNGQQPGRVGSPSDDDSKQQLVSPDETTEKAPSFVNPEAALMAAYSSRMNGGAAGERVPTFEANKAHAPHHAFMSTSSPASQAFNTGVSNLGCPFKFRQCQSGNARGSDYHDGIFGDTPALLGNTTPQSRALSELFNEPPQPVSALAVPSWEMQTLELQQAGDQGVHDPTEAEEPAPNADDSFYVDGYSLSVDGA
ncbi:uncharacterized protein EI97DRAFT_229212 [Westerdykella ornata]|uniref:Uncharacterized protein n=1 Tax=Westerdykella ornata TaxID=318751 RepID=A0A6A6J792_WESOR|nr:uncharacterized protein EI97DRAFT_229212 [Westerdykella ornata]KAF2272282.1 hypothetical protein EI97DRAFT_229212 [Westerdykella ornata]